MHAVVSRQQGAALPAINSCLHMQVDLPGPQPPQPSAVERDHPCQAPVYAQDPKLALPLQHMEARPCPSCGLAYFARQPAVRDIGIAAEHAPANQKADCWAPDPVDVAEPGEVQMMEARAMCPEGAPALREASLQIYRELATVSAAADGAEICPLHAVALSLQHPLHDMCSL